MTQRMELVHLNNINRLEIWHDETFNIFDVRNATQTLNNDEFY